MTAHDPLTNLIAVTTDAHQSRATTFCTPPCLWQPVDPHGPDEHPAHVAAVVAASVRAWLTTDPNSPLAAMRENYGDGLHDAALIIGDAAVQGLGLESARRAIERERDYWRDRAALTATHPTKDIRAAVDRSSLGTDEATGSAGCQTCGGPVENRAGELVCVSGSYLPHPAAHPTKEQQP